MRRRCCIRCDTPLEARTLAIDKRTTTAWVRVCQCLSVTGSGWYWRDDPPEIELNDDDVPAWSDTA